MSKHSLTNSIDVCNKIYILYKNILNSYVSDYYIDNHWKSKLSESWQDFLKSLDITEIANLLDCKKIKTAIPPLSLICLQEIIKEFSVTRKQQIIKDSISLNKQLEKLLWKSVKLKKRHEIEIMSKICYQSALKTNCFNIVDVGAGVGHLSRMLAYQYGFLVSTLEANEQLNQMAYKLDMELENKLLQKGIPHSSPKRILHFNYRVDESTTSNQIISIIKEAFESDNGQFKFGIVGLHPCGNLGSMLLKLYNNCSNISFINIVSCCYMKLSFESNLFTGYPLSHVCLKKQFKLDYLSCETACHAIENYVSKLKTENHHHLKIHAFRAGLETILVNINLDLKHSAVGNVKYEENMTFEEYCDRAVKKMNVQIPKSKVKDVEKMVEASWEKVVKFYSARLFLAPLVESIILYDRLLYLAESNSHCNIVPVFDCKISPRNHVLRAEKIFAKEY